MNVLAQFFNIEISDPLYKLFLLGCILNDGNYGNGYVRLPCVCDYSDFLFFIDEVSDSISLSRETCLEFYHRSQIDGFIKDIKTCNNCKFHLQSDHVHFLTTKFNIKCCEN